MQGTIHQTLLTKFHSMSVTVSPHYTLLTCTSLRISRRSFPPVSTLASAVDTLLTGYIREMSTLFQLLAPRLQLRTIWRV